MATAARPLERSVVSLSRSEARRSRITATPRVMPRVMTPAQAAASSSAMPATMMIVRLPPEATEAAAVEAASLNSSDWDLHRLVLLDEGVEGGQGRTLAVDARGGHVALADERDGLGDRGLEGLSGGLGLLQAVRHVEHGEAARLGQRLGEGVAVVALPGRLEASVERGGGAVEDRRGLDVERLTGGDLHRHDLLVEHRALLGVGRAIGEDAHLRHGDSRGDEHEDEGQREG